MASVADEVPLGRIHRDSPRLWSRTRLSASATAARVQLATDDPEARKLLATVV